jgi:hypothetical protein
MISAEEEKKQSDRLEAQQRTTIQGLRTDLAKVQQTLKEKEERVESLHGKVLQIRGESLKLESTLQDSVKEKEAAEAAKVRGSELMVACSRGSSVQGLGFCDVVHFEAAGQMLPLQWQRRDHAPSGPRSCLWQRLLEYVVLEGKGYVCHASRTQHTVHVHSSRSALSRHSHGDSVPRARHGQSCQLQADTHCPKHTSVEVMEVQQGSRCVRQLMPVNADVQHSCTPICLDGHSPKQ